ncbi:hypothetical protein [Methylobacterium tarhaniae]|uniref:hypothetical protein n=1 Tax=Methylobacterium tarhaniae TaxID=1187852 RepID=UPI000AF9DAC3|nr:hypothetical protein [Methylobacterium tarhaniae]
MVDRREKLLASKPAAQAAKDAFAAEYAAGRNDLAVGLGLNHTGDDWAVTVFAETPTAAQALPDHYGDYPVEVRVTGRTSAH